MFFYVKNGYANASECYVTSTMSVLLAGAAVCQGKRVTNVCKKKIKIFISYKPYNEPIKSQNVTLIYNFFQIIKCLC